MSVREETDYLSCSPGIRGDDVVHRVPLLRFGHWVRITSGGRDH